MRTEREIRQHGLDIAEDWDGENEYQEGRLEALDWVLNVDEVGNVPEANACAQLSDVRNVVNQVLGDIPNGYVAETVITDNLISALLIILDITK
jgi:hypothetical protein